MYNKDSTSGSQEMKSLYGMAAIGITGQLPLVHDL